jgi:DNA-binding beta-propeller fold protein YncE
MRALIAAAAAGLLIASGGAQAAEPPRREVAFVANAEAGTVTLVDVAARKVLGAIDINPGKRRIDRPGAPNYAQDTDVSPDGRFLYVSRGYLGDVAAFDIASGKLIWERPLNTARADHMTLTRDGASLFVSAMADDKVYRIATAGGAITGEAPTGVYPHDNKVSRDGRRLYNTSLGPIGNLGVGGGKPGTNPFQLTIADAASLAVQQRIRLDNAFRPWAFSADEKTLYAQLSNEHVVVAYDLASRRIVRRLALPIKSGVGPADWDFEAPHHGLALTEDGKTLCLAGRASDYVALARAPQLELIATIPVGDAPGWAEVADRGRLCLVAVTRADSLSIISIADRAQVATLPMGKGPKHITVAQVPAAVLDRFARR